MQGLDCKTLAYDSDSDYAVFFFLLAEGVDGFPSKFAGLVYVKLL
jgi:hypothetical protein